MPLTMFIYIVIYSAIQTTPSRMHDVCPKNPFHDNCRNSRARIGKFSLSISGQTHEFTIYAMCQRARVDNLTICYRKKKTNWSQFLMRLSCYWEWILSWIASWIHSYFDDAYVMTKFMINNRTDAWKTDLNLLILMALANSVVESG